MKKTKMIMPLHCSSDTYKLIIFYMEDATLIESIEELDDLTDNELPPIKLEEKFNNKNLSILYIYECYKWFVFFKKDDEWNYQTYYIDEFRIIKG